MSYTEEQFQALRNRDTRKIVPGSIKWPKLTATKNDELREFFTTVARDQAPKPNPRGHHVPGQMNKSETAFMMHLEIRRAAGEVRGWKFESVKLKLADRCTYTPDFCVEMANGDLVMVEVKRLWKGKRAPHWEDDARVKIKVAAELWRGWFSFYGVHWDGGKWVYEGF